MSAASIQDEEEPCWACDGAGCHVCNGTGMLYTERAIAARLAVEEEHRDDRDKGGIVRGLAPTLLNLAWIIPTCILAGAPMSVLLLLSFVAVAMGVVYAIG